MPVHTLDPLIDPRWSQLVDRHPRASVFHTRGWLEALARTHGYEPIVLTTCPPAAELTNGVVFCRISSWLTGRRMVSLPFADHCEPLVDGGATADEIIDSLPAALDRDDWKYIEIRSADPGFCGRHLQPHSRFSFHVLDLRPPVDELFRSLHKDSTQRKVRRGERERLTYEDGTSEALLKKFYGLLLLTRRRHGLPPQTIDWFRSLLACLRDRVTISVASKDGRPIAAIVTLSFAKTVMYKYGCSDASAHHLGGMQSLLWRAIRNARECRFETFDLGRSDPDNAGLITFKDRWGARRSVLTYVRCSAPRRRQAGNRHASAIAGRLLSRMPDALLTAAGKRLYRHIG